MHILALLFILLAAAPPDLLAQPLQMDTMIVTNGDTNRFWVQIPENYSSAQPPAILVWWHGLTGSQLEVNASGFSPFINTRGWIAACHMGPNDRHWNTRISQDDCDAMLDWIMTRYPFSMDSIYMVGSSMGGAGGLVWHNNNCGLSDYLIAAAACGSPILDCELRQQQYLDSGHVNVSMSVAFGGFPNDNDSVDFEYHRYSAVFLADTSHSSHFNGLHLPAYVTWGTSDSSWLAEWFAYGRPAQEWDTLRQFDNADTTLAFCSNINGHGYQVLVADSVLNWLSGFSVNRFPERLSISADENDEYYWTRVTLGTEAYVFGRYGVERNFVERRLDINLVRNIAVVDVEFAFPWPMYDSLHGHWLNRDSAAVPQIIIRFTHLPTPVIAVSRNGIPIPFLYENGVMTVAVPPSGDYTVHFEPLGADVPDAALPREVRLVDAYPNPFNSQITLTIESASVATREIRIYDITGRLAQSIRIQLQPGVQNLIVSGDGMASGIYFVDLPNTGRVPLKIVLLK